MLTKLTIVNFKRFSRVEIELGSPVVFIGPNNSGKTSALQALALWEIGCRRWNEKRSGKKEPEKRPGVAINRKDLIALPVPDANLLWRNLHVRDVTRFEGKQQTTNVRIDVVVEGVTEDKTWQCGFEFDYANEESFYCRPLRLAESKNPERMIIPAEAADVQIGFLPPMSGLAANERRLDPGAVNVLIGEGRTAEVLRNLCLRIYDDGGSGWDDLIVRIQSLFGVTIGPPVYVRERGEIVMTYRERGAELDLSSSGRGLQQTLLLLAYMYGNPGSVLLLDEPDAHLEILRQRQIYQLLTDVARENGNQLIAASHSEVILNEAAGRDVLVAFVGKPHRVNDRASQVSKALKEIGFEDYYLAQLTGWVLYLEGATDFAILRAFAERLRHAKGLAALERPFVHYVANQPLVARRHFFGLREAVPHLKGIALFDRLDGPPMSNPGVSDLQWRRREIESYFCLRETLLAYARSRAELAAAGPLFTPAEAERRLGAMEESIREVEDALATVDRGSPWDGNLKVSDEFLAPLFKRYFAKLNLPNVMEKKNFHELAWLVPVAEIDPEVGEVLDAIGAVNESAESRREPEDE